MPRPDSIRVIRILGSGRAARAQLVEATMADGTHLTCVEKVFRPGRLTRWIYRVAFAAPFAYQTNRDAILASFYRRRVAAAVLGTGSVDVRVAMPLYVRYCDQSKAWVLAAEWIEGRGIRPQQADPTRLRRWMRRQTVSRGKGEIGQLIETMQAAEDRLTESGLSGSGWQVSPRAMVSTANLLRQGDRYTIIDLESGIPAVLVPKYIAAGLRCATAPPFDDLNPARLRAWLDENRQLIKFRLGIQTAATIGSDVEKLVEHTRLWKDAELAPLRRPWRLFRPGGMRSYQQATIQHWQRSDIIDQQTAKEIERGSGKGRAIWYLLWIPWFVGTVLAKLIGHRNSRRNAVRLLTNPMYRRARWQNHLNHSQQRWLESGRIGGTPVMTSSRYVLHRSMSLLPIPVHRFVTDSARRRQLATWCALCLLSGRYQAWLGQKHINHAIDRWVAAQRISVESGRRLRQDARGSEIRSYSRGFGMHVALKFLAPVVIPAKIGSIMAFVANGNGWFLVPLAATPALRMMVTIGNWIHSRRDQVRHREALAVSWLPFVGSIAFPLQMYASRPELATFLIRDAASRVGCRLPIYGGADSRTELACIEATDLIIESLDVATELTGRKRDAHQIHVFRDHKSQSDTTESRTRFGRWIDRLAQRRIADESGDAGWGTAESQAASERTASEPGANGPGANGPGATRRTAA